MNWYFKTKIAQAIDYIDQEVSELKPETEETYLQQIDKETEDRYKKGYSKGWLSAIESMLIIIGIMKGNNVGEWRRAMIAMSEAIKKMIWETPYTSKEESAKEYERMKRLALQELKKRIIKIARRSRYPGQLEGDEDRPGEQIWQERYVDNEKIEGEHVLNLHTLAQKGNWETYNNYIEKLKKEGFNQSRIDSIVSRSMLKVNLNKVPST